MQPQIGKVYLIGAGPGDPGLITLRGAECLHLADVVLYDYLAAPELLSHARLGAELICLGRHGCGRLMSQTETCAAMVRHAKSGHTVARLKGGDPAVFARLAEEIAALEAEAVPYEIVPGVTAASAASSHGGVPLTDRDEASCVAFVTGHERPEKESHKTLDYAALGKFPGTLVFYMGITTAPHWSHALIDGGKSAATPVAIVRRCSLPDQQTIVTSLGELPGLLQSKKLRPPAVIIVGDVARTSTDANWFNARPLFGRTVLVTRPEHQADALAKRLGDLGASVICQPAIEITPPHDWSAVDATIGRLKEFDWLAFSSANGVQYFLNRILALGHDMRALGNAKLAAIGPATALELSKYHLRTDARPDTYRAEALAESLAPHVRGKRVLLLRASRGREVLAEILQAAGALVEQVVVYESSDIFTPYEEVLEALVTGKVDFMTVTSSAIAQSLANMFGEALLNTRLAAISPITADTLAELGYPASVVADSYTCEGIVAAILDAAGKL